MLDEILDDSEISIKKQIGRTDRNVCFQTAGFAFVSGLR